jgi:hypothetical protein
MPVNRREFLAGAAISAAALKANPQAWALGAQAAPVSAAPGAKKNYGSGYFGSWIEDEFGLPAFHYTCDQSRDQKAATDVNAGILSSREHVHQVGNDRLVALASNYGHVRVRQDEGAPKFLNDYAPERGLYGGGFGYLTDGKTVLSTFYPGNASSFDRVFGIGYFRKTVRGESYTVDQLLFVPFGDDPVMVSQVAVSNSGPARVDLRWIEYWGCQQYQFSFRSFMESLSGKSMHDLRRDLGARFEHRFRSLEGARGLLERKEFIGHDQAEERQFAKVVDRLEKNPDPFLTAPAKDAPRNTGFEDLGPRPTFLVSLDAPADRISTNGRGFFGAGGTAHPSGLERELDGDLETTGPESALLLERNFSLNAGESRRLAFLYGYLPSGFDLNSLLEKYRAAPGPAFEESCRQWKQHGLRFSVPDEPWVEREIKWHNYYLRSGITYDDFFHQHILSQAAIYQYVVGFQGAARDPLQHALPFIFTDADLAKQVLRYTLKEIRPDGSIPYGIVGHGMPMPTVSDNASDIPMWLIWAVSEYVLGTRDIPFLDSGIVTVYGANAGRDTVRGLLARCYTHLVNDVRTGEHGLMRMLQDDWNDALVQAWVAKDSLAECREKGESVLNSAMAAYVFDAYASMLAYAGEDERVTSPIRTKAEEHRTAVRMQWTGKWFRRAWLGPTQGWLGEKGMWLEPQPWALVARIADEQQTHTLIESIDQELRRVSPIGAIQQSDSPERSGRGTWHIEPGTSVAGGVWPSLNQTLVWALAAIDGTMAWDEWKKNTLARHAETYPEVWYGTWSGPDVINSRSSKEPGKTTGGRPFGWTDFPVLNMHVHAAPLYSAAKLLGVQFTETGVSFAPKLPLASFRFDSPLVGLEKSPQGYSGWYNPMSENTWAVRLQLSAEEAKHLARMEVNGNRVRSRTVDRAIELRGEGGNGKPLRWAVARG